MWGEGNAAEFFYEISNHGFVLNISIDGYNRGYPDERDGNQSESKY